MCCASPMITGMLCSMMKSVSPRAIGRSYPIEQAVDEDRIDAGGRLVDVISDSEPIALADLDAALRQHVQARRGLLPLYA